MEPPISRYSRHTLLRWFGDEGQKRVERSRVFVAGLGALGSTITMLLARAGVGFMRIADYDTPELHNLHRQILYTEADLATGKSKAEIARERLIEANSATRIEAVTTLIDQDNAHDLTKNVDLVVDGLDNLAGRYVINDAVIERGIPYVFGGAVEAAGNVMVIIPGKTACLRCLWPQSDAVEAHPRAREVGVLSSAAVTVAGIQVTEALKILAGRFEEVLDGLLVMDFLRNTFQTAPVAADPACRCRER